MAVAYHKIRDNATAILSEGVEITLACNAHGVFLAVLVIVVAFLGPDVQNHSNGQKIEVRHGQPDLQTAKQEKRRCYFPGAGIPFFLDWISVTRFVPQRSRISGSTW